jgi:hypothetical protein
LSFLLVLALVFREGCRVLVYQRCWFDGRCRC